ncbi:YdeI/OmpD-associated family protein [Flexithrix dorotheae]|uniref:YdeI/OmpD-associated family protein n=1 Tax=Flexithrix dorotheae TaxID=70993 RepID=UPI00037C6DC2|nr:YdeI/OmpD-associated family protein [Flexithrix dorotheae]
MKTETPLVDSEYLLEKFPGKGGWTYAAIPEIAQNKNNPFGWVKVRGFVDEFELKQYKLMPMGNGKLFLPVKAQIRRKIKKEAGDLVKVVLYSDESPLEIPTEIIECFKNEPQKIYETFLSFTEGEQKTYIDWIYEAKTEDTKADRIVKMMDRLQRNLRFYDKEIL